MIEKMSPMRTPMMLALNIRWKSKAQEEPSNINGKDRNVSTEKWELEWQKRNNNRPGVFLLTPYLIFLTYQHTYK